MKKALLLGLGLSMCVSQAQAEPLTVVGRVLADIAPYGTAASSAIREAAAKYLFVAGVFVVGCAAFKTYLHLTGYFPTLEGATLGSLTKTVGGIALCDLVVKAENDPAQAAALMYRYYGAMQSYDCSRGCLMNAAEDLEYAIKRLVYAEQDLREALPSLWKTSTKERYNKLITQLAELQAFMVKVTAIIKASFDYKQQVETYERNRADQQDKSTKHEAERREYEIRLAQAQATRKIIINKNGQEGAIVA